MMRFIQKLFRISCKDTSPLISEMMDHPLSFPKQAKVKVHLAMCQVCRFYQDQLKVLQHMARKIDRVEQKPSDKPTLSKETKQKIQKTLQSLP